MGFFDSKSTSSNTTNNDTDNYSQNIDRRSVASDAAVSLTGDRNTVDRSTTTSTADSRNMSTWMQDNANNSTNFSDSSTRNTFTDSSTTFTDGSDRSTRMTDNSNRSSSNITEFVDKSVRDNSTRMTDSSVRDSSTRLSDSSVRHSVDNSDRSVNYTSTDYGSVGLALGGLTQMSTKSLDVTAGAVNGVIGALKGMSGDSLLAMKSAFDFAGGASANSMSNSAAVMGFANSALKETSAAFAEAKDNGQSKMVMYAIGAIAVIGVAFALKS